MKKNLILGLLLLAFVGTASTFAWWFSGAADAESLGETNNAITIGTANKEYETELTIGANLNNPETPILVPVGEKANSTELNAVEFVVFGYAISWDAEDGEDVDGLLSVALQANSVHFVDDEDDDAAHLLVVKFFVGEVDTEITDENFGDFEPDFLTSLEDVEIVLGGDPVYVYVIVQLSAPVDQEEYDLVAGKAVSFKLDYKVEVDE